MLDLDNCRLKQTCFKDKYDTRMYSFSLMAKGTVIEFFIPRSTEQREWIEAMKPYVILVDLKNEFNIGKLIGKGSSA